MTRPTTRIALLAAAAERFATMTALVNGLPVDELTAEFAFAGRDRNARDVLWHLHTWHDMVSEWHQIGTVEGGIPAVPGYGYTWRTLPDLNRKVWEVAQNVDLNDARRALESSHSQVMGLIEAHTDEELFSRGVYPWTKSTTLGSYFVSATSSHYDWALKKLRAHKSTRQS